MTDLKKTLTKGALGTVAAGAMALASASPAMADDRNRDRGIDAGDVIAGAVIIGGIAAIAGAFGNDRDDRYRDRRYRGERYDDRRYNDRRNGYRDQRQGRRAVEKCINAAEYRARRWGGYRYADVTEIRDVDRTRYGLRVKGRIQVEGSRGYRGRDYDQGRFTCQINRRGHAEIDFGGLRGLR